MPIPADLEAEPAGAVDVFGVGLQVAQQYVGSLAVDGVIRGLIGPREAPRLWTRHVLNSVAVAELIPADSTVVDIGSGAGLPGIPLAIARPDLRVTLVEPLARRVQYLVETVAALDISNVVVVRGRAESVVAQCGRADVVTSRAVAPLHRVAAWSAPLARTGGLVLALKGESAEAELARDRGAVTAAGLTDAEVIVLGADGPADRTYVVRARRAGRGR